MIRLLRRFLHLEEGEGAKIAQLALVGLLLQAGLTMGMNGADSLFLVKAGADKLPRIYLAMPVIMLIYIPVYSALMTRWGLDRIFDATLALLVAGGAGLWFALGHAGASELPLAYAAKLYAAVWYVGLYTLYWNFIDGYFNLIDAKRLFALLAAGSALGAIAGGTLVGPVSRLFGVPALFLCWAILTAAAWPVALWARRRHPKLESEESAEESAPGWGESLGILRRLLHTRYALVLALVLFFTLIAATTAEFQYLTLFSNGRDEAQLAALLGRLSAMVNVFNLGVSLLVFNQLVAKLGVRNVALLQSAAYAVVFSWLLLDGGFPAAVAGFFAYQGLMTSVDFNNANLLFAGLPADLGKQMRTIIEGICEPLATATAGFFLLLVAPRLTPEQISLAGVVVALIGLALVFILRYDYVAAIGANLRRDWLDLSRPSEPLLRAATPADLDLVEARAAAAGPEEAAIALRVLWLNAPLRGVRALLAFVRRAPAGSQIPVKLLLDEALARPDSADAREIQRWLDEYDSDPDAEFPDADLAGELGRALPPLSTWPHRGPAPPRRPGGAAGPPPWLLWQSWRVRGVNCQALHHVAELLAAGDERSTLAGVHTTRLDWGGAPRLPPCAITSRLPSPRIRKTALNALRGLADPSSGILLPEVLAVVAETTGEERLFALEAFERIGDASALPALLAQARGFTPAERRRTGQLILHLGQSSVPILIELAQNSRFLPAGRSVALRALGKLALPQMQLLATPLVEQSARRAYAVLASYAALTRRGTPGRGRPRRARPPLPGIRLGHARAHPGNSRRRRPAAQLRDPGGGARERRLEGPRLRDRDGRAGLRPRHLRPAAAAPRRPADRGPGRLRRRPGPRRGAARGHRPRRRPGERLSPRHRGGGPGPARHGRARQQGAGPGAPDPPAGTAALRHGGGLPRPRGPRGGGGRGPDTGRDRAGLHRRAGIGGVQVRPLRVPGAAGPAGHAGGGRGALRPGRGAAGRLADSRRPRGRGRGRGPARAGAIAGVEALLGAGTPPGPSRPRPESRRCSCRPPSSAAPPRSSPTSPSRPWRKSSPA